MKKLMNVLYVTSHDSYLALDGTNVVVLVDGSEKFRLPIHTLESIVSFGYSGASPALMGYCSDNGVGLCFVSQGGRFLARISGRVQGNVLLRKKQYAVSASEADSVLVAMNFIVSKLCNSRVVLERVVRDHPEAVDVDSVRDASLYLKSGIKRLQSVSSLGEIQGIEGDCARRYFGVFNELILHNKEHFFMNNRSKRPPLDFVNCLLSFLYTLLVHDVQTALETVGLDPYVGFLHRDRPGRASLALDMMEELRAYFVDRLVLSLINRKQVDEKGFLVKESGGVIMTDETRKEVILAWQKRKQEEIVHPFLNEKISVGLIPYVQSLLLARYIRGNLDGYPPFLWK